MHSLNLDRYPLDQPDSTQYKEVVAECRAALANDGMFNLAELLPAEACNRCVGTLRQGLATDAFTHQREHNAFFTDSIDDLPQSHRANTRLLTTNHTLCLDQLGGTLLPGIYNYRPFINFLSDALELPELFPMADPLAGLNVMAYDEGEALNWHFDRSEFTTTLLLQAPDAGGEFEYRRGLKSIDASSGQSRVDYEGLGQLLADNDASRQTLSLKPGTLNVFRGSDTVHRVTPVSGDTARIIAVFSYFDKPGVVFSNAERLGFYGREQ